MPSSKPLGTTSKSTTARRQLSLPFKPERSNANPSPWTPHTYQRRAVKWLLEHPEAALLLDLGLGKTAIALEAFQALRRAGGARRALVVAPRRPAQLVWSHEGEVGKWDQFQSLRVALLHGDDKDDALGADADLYVINYDGLAWLAKRDGFRRLLARGVDVLIFDELSKLKHPRTQRMRLLKPWLGRFRRRWGLTGSPASRSLMDLFGQVFALDLGRRLGRYITHYRQKYFYPTGFGGFEWRPQPDAEKQIFAALRDLALAMRSQDHLDLPDLVERNVWVDLPSDARRVYDELEDELIAQVEGGVVMAKNAAVAASKCCQVASGGVYREVFDGPPTTEGEFTVQSGRRETVHIHDAKTEALVDLVEECQGAPVVILYDFQHDLERLRGALGADVPVLGGGTSDRDAMTIVRQWNEGALPLLLGHPGSMGHGLNMQAAGCGHIIFYTTTWDRELYDQVIGRFRRQGATVDRVFVHRILARDTVDEAKVKSLAAKNRTQRAVFDALVSRWRNRRRRSTKEDE